MKWFRRWLGPKIDPAINPRHRYLIRRNHPRAYVGSTDNLGEHLETGHCLVDTIGVDGLGMGIKAYLRSKGDAA